MISDQTGVEINPNDIGLKVYKDHDAYSEENEDLPDTGAEESEKVWSALFDEDEEGKLGLTETGAAIATVAESVLGDTEGEGDDKVYPREANLRTAFLVLVILLVLVVVLVLAHKERCQSRLGML